MKSIRIVFIAATVLALTLTTNAGGFRGGGCGGGFRGGWGWGGGCYRGGGYYGGGWGLGLGFGGCGLGVSLGFGGPACYGGCGDYRYAPAYPAAACAGPVYPIPV